MTQSTLLRAGGVGIVVLFLSCAGEPDAALPDGTDAMRENIAHTITDSGAEVGLYYRSLGADADSLAINADLRMHAASTMKVPVMMRLYKDHEAGGRSIDSDIEVRRTFRSIVDGEPFDLPPESDSDTTLYARMGTSVTIREMTDRMITWSSNLATNILIEVAEPDRINAMLRGYGADSMEVLRGVEDLAAFRAGLSNTTTARDLGVVMGVVARGEGFSAASRDEMVAILERQHFRENIPAGLPTGTRVANKTGWITGINHDAAIVYPEGDDPYILVVLIRGHPAEDQGTALAAELSGLVWTLHGGRVR